MIIFLSVVFFLFFLGLGIYSFQEYIMFNPIGCYCKVSSDTGLGIREVYFRSQEGYRLHGWHVYPPIKRSHYTILICHGTRGNLTTPFRIALLRSLAELGMEMFIFDYSGIGRSEGRVSEKNAYGDARAAFNYLTVQKGVANEEMILFGRSLGGPVACRLAAEVDPALLILESTFYSMVEEVRYLFPFLPSCLLSMVVGDRFPTYRFYRNIKCPCLILHGTEDRLVPFESGRKLYESCPSAGRVFVPIEGGGHKSFKKKRALYVSSLLKGVGGFSFILDE